DLQFVDVLGALQHITIPATSLGNEEFKRGIGKLDGSSIKGFKEIHESDMVMNPDPSTFAVLPWYEGEHRTARFIVDVYEGGSHERFTRDSRYMAQKAAQFAADQGYDTTYWGPEIEFFVFDGIRLLPSADAARNPWSGAGYEIVSREAPWNDSGGKEFPIRFKEGYYPAPPVDSLQDCRYYIGGLMDHARSLCAFTNPTTNSYRRLVPGYEAPVFIAWSKRNRSANIRIPMYYQGIEAAKRIEYRTPDPACNPYLSFAAM